MILWLIWFLKRFLSSHFCHVFLPTILTSLPPGVMLLNRSTSPRDSATNIEKISRKGTLERERPNRSILIMEKFLFSSFHDFFPSFSWVRFFFMTPPPPLVPNITTIHPCALCTNTGEFPLHAQEPNYISHFKTGGSTVGSFIFIVLLSHLYIHYTHETYTMLSEKTTLHIPIVRLIQFCCMKK